MIFARPPDGFHVVEQEEVTRRIEAEVGEWDRLAEHWTNLKERLSMTGHREGTPVTSEGAGFFVFEPTWSPDLGLPRLRLFYQILGETLTIHSVLVTAE